MHHNVLLQFENELTKKLLTRLENNTVQFPTLFKEIVLFSHKFWVNYLSFIISKNISLAIGKDATFHSLYHYNYVLIIIEMG